MALVPYFLTAGANAFSVPNASAMTFTTDDEYLLGDNIFVSLMTRLDAKCNLVDI